MVIYDVIEFVYPVAQCLCSVGGLGLSDVMTQPSGDELTVLLCVPSPHEAEQSSQSNISHTQGQASVLHGCTVGGLGLSDVISQSSG